MNHKSLFIFFLTLFSIITIAKAQNKEFIAGALIGFNGIHINGEIRDMYSPTNGQIWGTGGLSFGLNVKRSFSNSIYGSFELRYIRKGSLYEFVTNYGTQAFESIKLDYIEFPILFGLIINLKKKYLLFETGIAYARLMNSRMSVSDLNQWDTSSKLDHFKKNDLSYVANLKYPLIKSEKLQLGFRFSYSLISIHEDYKLYNLIYGIEVYYLFNRNIK